MMLIKRSRNLWELDFDTLLGYLEIVDRTYHSIGDNYPNFKSMQSSLGNSQHVSGVIDQILAENDDSFDSTKSNAESNPKKTTTKKKHRLFDKKIYEKLTNSNTRQTKQIKEAFNIRDDDGYRDLKPVKPELFKILAPFFLN